MKTTIVETTLTSRISSATNCNAEVTSGCAKTARNASRKNGDATLTKIAETEATKIVRCPLVPRTNSGVIMDNVFHQNGSVTWKMTVKTVRMKTTVGREIIQKRTQILALLMNSNVLDHLNVIQDLGFVTETSKLFLHFDSLYFKEIF